VANLVESFSPIFEGNLSVRVFLTLLHFLWQGALFGVVVAVVCRLLRGVSARTRYRLYCVALLSLPVCVVVTFGVISLPSDLSLASQLATTRSGSPQAAQPETSSTTNDHSILNGAAVDIAEVRDHRASMSPGSTSLLFRAAPWFAVAYVAGVSCFLLVVSSGCDSMRYAGALLRMAERCAGAQHARALGLAASGESPTLLETRVERLMNWSDTPRLQLTRGGMTGLLVVLSSLIAIPGITHHWLRAQTPSDAANADPLADATELTKQSITGILERSESTDPAERASTKSCPTIVQGSRDPDDRQSSSYGGSGDVARRRSDVGNHQR
jgi:hypothetical protein